MRVRIVAAYKIDYIYCTYITMIKLRALLLLSNILLLIARQAKCQAIDTLIDVGTYKLHFKIIKGKGTPVLFESGGGLDASQWNNIVIPLYKTTGATLITYDRQGFGMSGIDTTNYTIQNEIGNLEKGLAKLGYENKPMILVCHSLGAFYSRVYASMHPKLVKGIVMLDPRIPSHTDEVFASKNFEVVKHAYDIKKLSGSDLALYYVFKTMVSNESIVEACSLPVSVPILDIMAEIGPYDKTSDNARFKSDQRSFVKQGTNRKLMFAQGSSHDIPRSKRELVINKVDSFYRKYH